MYWLYYIHVYIYIYIYMMYNIHTYIYIYICKPAGPAASGRRRGSDSAGHPSGVNRGQYLRRVV